MEDLIYNQIILHINGRPLSHFKNPNDMLSTMVGKWNYEVRVALLH